MKSPYFIFIKPKHVSEIKVYLLSCKRILNKLIQIVISNYIFENFKYKGNILFSTDKAKTHYSFY